MTDERLWFKLESVTAYKEGVSEKIANKNTMYGYYNSGRTNQEKAIDLINEYLENDNEISQEAFKYCHDTQEMNRKIEIPAKLLVGIVEKIFELEKSLDEHESNYYHNRRNDY